MAGENGQDFPEEERHIQPPGGAVPALQCRPLSGYQKAQEEGGRGATPHDSGHLRESTLNI